MKHHIPALLTSAAAITFIGCSNRGNTSPFGSANRNASAYAGNTTAAPHSSRNQQPSNVEKGEPPGSSTGGTGPAHGAPIAGWGTSRAKMTGAGPRR